MAKSKRNKIVHLTQVKKKGKDHKEDLMKQVEQYVAQFTHVFLFDFDQTKSDRIMELRVKLKEFGRIFAGLNSIVVMTLKKIGDRTNTDFEELIKQVVGKKGLLFTDLSSEKLIEKLDKELPEFCKRLVGYAKIAPEYKNGKEPIEASMDLDRNKVEEEDEEEDDDDDTADAGDEDEGKGRKGKRAAPTSGSKTTKITKKNLKKKTGKSAERRKLKRSMSRNKNSQDRREVKFVRI